MREISSAEAQENFTAYRKLAEGLTAEPETVTVLHHDKPSVVIVSAAEYERLKRRDKQVLLTEEAPEWLIECIATIEMDPAFNELNESI